MCKNIVLQQLLALFNNTANASGSGKSSLKADSAAEGSLFLPTWSCKREIWEILKLSFSRSVCLGFIWSTYTLSREKLCFFNLNTVQMSYYCDTACFWSLFFPVFTLRIPLIFLLQSKAAICALTLHFRTITQSKLSVLIERDVCQTGVPLPLILLWVWVTDWIIN